MDTQSEAKTLDRPITRRTFLIASPVAVACLIFPGRYEEVWPISLAWAFDGPDHLDQLYPGIELSVSKRGRRGYVKHGVLVLGCLPPDFSKAWIRRLKRGQASVCLERVSRDGAGRLCLSARWRRRA